jgi:hypothetical protein
MRIIKLLGILLSLASLSALGQSTATQVAAQSSPGVSTLPVDYSAEPIVIEKLDSVYEMAADGTGSKQTTVVAKVQSESAVRQLGVVNIPFAGNSERVEIGYVRVRRPRRCDFSLWGLREG